MPDINVDSSQITKVQSIMTQNMDFVTGELETLRLSVQTLLEEPGGLWMKQSSPLLREQFSKFAQDLSEAVKNIKSFSDTFGSILDNLQKLDQGYAKVDESSSQS